MPRDPLRTFDAEHRARLIELHGQGRSLQSIAKELGFSSSTISIHAARAGLEWDRAQTKVAVEAHKADAAALRAELMVEALEAAKEMLAARADQFLVFNFGGKDNTYEERTLDKPPTGDLRNLMQSFGILVQRSMDLAKFDSDPNEGLSAVDDWLDAMTGDDPPVPEEGQ